MGYALIGEFDTAEEAKAFAKKLVKEDKRITEDMIHIFNNEKQFGFKEYTVNID